MVFSDLLSIDIFLKIYILITHEKIDNNGYKFKTCEITVDCFKQ